MTTKRKTIDEVKEYIKNETNNEYELISNQYENQLQKLSIRHYLEDGTYHDYSANYKSFKSGRRCPICNFKKLKNRNPNKKTLEQVKEEVQEKFEGEYELMINSYKSNKIKIPIKHNLKNGESHIFEMRLNDLLSGHKCNFCNPAKLNKKIASKNILNKTNNEFKLISEIENSRGKIIVKHIKCNTEISCTYNAIMRNSVSCYKCKCSKGEKELINIFKNKNIKFIQQYKNSLCKNKKELPFDFLIEYNGIKALIEFDGEQHYKPIYGEQDFEQRKINDRIKSEFCRKYKIPFLRIKEEYIDSLDIILDNFLYNLEFLSCL